MNIAEHLEHAARVLPDASALIFEERSWSYRELDAATSRLAAALAHRGVAPGDRVALFLPNIPEFCIAYLAAQKLGAVAVSVNALLKTAELRYFLEDSGARVLFTTAALWGEVAPLRESLGLVPVICEGDVADETSMDALIAGAPDGLRARFMEPDEPAAILYTSGTTGRQKGAVLTHGNVVSNYHATRHCVGCGPGDRHLLFLPLFHCFGQNFIMNAALASGGTIVLQRRFEPEATLALIRERRVTHLYCVPTIYIVLLDAGVPTEALASVRYCFSAAATMPVEVARRWHATHGLPVYEGYGLTETSPFASYNHELAHRPGSIGTPIENVEMRIVDAEDRELGAGEWGEICIRGPNVMAGYFDRPEETERALRGGWFHSGDVGYRDDDGYFYIVDRVKDMINAAGFKVWPREVEEALYEHPAIRECAVVGLEDAVKGEVVAAYVSLQGGAALAEDELVGWCRERMAAYKVPRHVVFTDAIPKSPTGKILKRVLRASGLATGA